MKTIQRLAIFSALALFTTGAVAQETAQEVPTGHLLVKTIVQKEEVVIDDNGDQKVQLVDARVVVPGDEVIYTVTFQNISDAAADNVVITNPIAADLVYVDGSAFGPGSNIVFSVDGGQTFAATNELSVTENGTTRPAEPRDFTHIRWQMQNEIPAGTQGVARFRARLQ
ncbi:MAG: hypothetical protein OEW68_00480 [Gammaproteobacteria bacterium]|nr:hypothetical protein [Gammaproteobacteria bacterium]MDH4313299.1 hypothetical protein [Gammaproteobacteria bacterium]MDH5212900.1 hypothetical protein [Gammaproteobacteria bacterium]MDH5499788.1 hypothetical protein [Gammaproteobacteria bacterium]